MTETHPGDGRHHVDSLLMRESLLDKDLVAATDEHGPLVRMLPDARVLKIGGRSIIDRGRRGAVPPRRRPRRGPRRPHADHRHRRRRAQPPRVLDRPRPRAADRGARPARHRRRPRQRPHPRHAARPAWRGGDPARNLTMKLNEKKFFFFFFFKNEKKKKRKKKKKKKKKKKNQLLP